MNILQKKSYLSLFVIALLQILFFYLVYLGYRGEEKLLVITQADKTDKNFKKKTQQLSDMIIASQAHFNQYILYRELPNLQSYNQILIDVSSNLSELVKNENQSYSLRSKLKKNISVNKKLIALKIKIDSLFRGKGEVLNNVDLDAILKLSNYRFDDVLNSVEFETDKKVDSVKKKGLFSRLGNAMKGKSDVQKEQINNVLRLKFGKKIVSGDVKEQFRNVLIESQKHYNKQFNILGKSLANIKKGEKNLIQKNTSLMKLYLQINLELESMIDGILDNNAEKMHQQTRLNKELRFYLIITVMIMIFLMLILLFKYINDTFRVKRELSEAKDQISKDLFLKNRIISTLTHEIKTPVSIINLYGSIIGDKIKNKELHEFLDAITYTSNTLMYISNQAVELVRNDEGDVKLNLVKVDLSKESKSIINSLKIFASSKNIKLNFDNQLPLKWEVQYDKAKFYQLVYNIVGNSVKFAKSTIDVTAKFKQLEDGEQFMFIVRDDGNGIPAKDKEYVFDLEYQSKNSKSVDALSFGLGLYLCKNIVSASQGEIFVESELNKGTEISFILKLKKS